MGVVSDLLNSGDCPQNKPFNNSVVEGLVQIDDEINSFYQSITASINQSLNQQTNRLNQLYAKLIEPLSNRLMMVVNNINRMYQTITNDLNIRLQTTASQGSNYKSIPPEILPTIGETLPEPVYSPEEITGQDDPDNNIPIVSSSDIPSVDVTNTGLLSASPIPTEPRMGGSFIPIDSDTLSTPDDAAIPSFIFPGVETVTIEPTTLPPLPTTTVIPTSPPTTTEPIKQPVTTTTTFVQCCNQIALALTQIGATQQQQQIVANYLAQIVGQQQQQLEQTKEQVSQQGKSNGLTKQPLDFVCKEGIDDIVKNPFCDIQTYKQLYEHEQNALNNHGLDPVLYAASFEYDRQVGDTRLAQLEAMANVPREE